MLNPGLPAASTHHGVLKAMVSDRFSDFLSVMYILLCEFSG